MGLDTIRDFDHLSIEIGKNERDQVSGLAAVQEEEIEVLIGEEISRERERNWKIVEREKGRESEI